MSTKPHATVDGTTRLAERMIAQGWHRNSYRRLGRTGLQVSVMGFGGYRIRKDVEAHVAALRSAIRCGFNLIDTSGNYGDGSSELLIGRVLREVCEPSARDELVVVSKAGYVQGSCLVTARERAFDNEPYPEMVEYREGCWHCIHPTYLEEQLQDSLDRLGLEQIDVFLLHNPEYFLTDALARYPECSLEERREEYYERLRRAFTYLEEEVRKGRIRSYGVSSNTLVVPNDDPCATSLSRMLEIVREVGGDEHHFSVIQLPLNLGEIGGVVNANQGSNSSRTVLEEAANADIAVLCNRPLNAFIGDNVIRLADFPLGDSPGRVDRLLRGAERLESEFAAGIGQYFIVDDDEPEHAGYVFRLARAMVRRAEGMADVVTWNEYVDLELSGQLSMVVGQIDEALNGPMKAAWQFWLERYVAQMGDLAEALRLRCARQSQKRSRRVARTLRPWMPEGRRSAPLSQQALAAVRGLPGVTAVLVGMRQTKYVEDVLEEVCRDEVLIPAEAFRKVAKGLAG